MFLKGSFHEEFRLIVLNFIFYWPKIEAKEIRKEAVMLGFLFLIFSSFPLLSNPLPDGYFFDVGRGWCLENGQRILLTDEILEGFGDDNTWLDGEAERAFKNLEEAKKCLKCLEEERKILVGDFYGINLTAYRYVNIFDRLGYIRYKIGELDMKIKTVKTAVSRLKKKQMN